MARLSEEQRAQIRALRASQGKDAARAARFQMRTEAGLPTNPANALTQPSMFPPAPSASAQPSMGVLKTNFTPEELEAIERSRALRGDPANAQIQFQMGNRNLASATTSPAANPNKLSAEDRARIQAVREAEGQEAAQALRYELRTAAGLPTNPANAPATGEAPAAPTPDAPAEDKPVTFGPRISKRMDKMFGLGQEMVERFLPDISVLGTVDPSRSAEMQEALAMSKVG